VPSKKREVTIRFVTAARGTKISAIIDAISDQADDVSITCRTVDQRLPAANHAKSGPTVSNGTRHAEQSQPLPQPREPQLVYKADGGNRAIDVEASLAKLGLKREELLSRRWERGSPQHRLKRAAASASRMH